MEAYAKALLYAIPFFIGLVLFEIGYGYVTGRRSHRAMDTISSLSSGLTNIIKDSLGLVVVIISYPFLLDYLALFELQSDWLTYAFAFIAIDFASYWNHRLNHHVNLFWNQHVIHHSSEEFNLACALRQPISNILGYFPLLLIPAAIVGVPHDVISFLLPIHLFAQFWYHTKYIGKLGLLEYIIVTPSQHRVHHAINEEYIDKNLAAIFCVWDRAFGTFQEELADVPPVYGVLKPANTWNPILINFQHVWRLIQDAWRTRSFKDKFRIWFMPTGWRPSDVAERYPIHTINNVYDFEKYRTPASRGLKLWSTYHLVITTVLMLFMFYNYSVIGFNNLLLYGLIVFAGIYGYTSLMDRKSHAVIVECIRACAGLTIIYITGDWFGLNQYLPYGHIWISLYFISVIVGALWFSPSASIAKMEKRAN